MASLECNRARKLAAQKDDFENKHRCGSSNFRPMMGATLCCAKTRYRLNALARALKFGLEKIFFESWF